MDIKKHSKTKHLFKYAFMWNQVRLVVAALSLIFGGFPVAYRIFSSSGFVSPLLTLCWVISGISALYLLWLFVQGGKTIWGGHNRVDMIAFAVAIISGLHLGIAGVTGTNIGMAVVPSMLLSLVMLAAGFLYLWSAYHLHTRYKTGGSMFGIKS